MMSNNARHEYKSKQHRQQIDIWKIVARIFRNLLPNPGQAFEKYRNPLKP